MVGLILSDDEARVLGCLLEKERITPEAYPLSLNGLLLACNQTSNREPVLTLDAAAVEQAVEGLREKKLATIIHVAGARVPKYRHTIGQLFNLNTAELGLLCILLLRGPQTPGELRLRAERLAGTLSLTEIEGHLVELAAGEDPFVQILPPRPGQKESRWAQLLCGPPTVLDRAPVPVPAASPAQTRLEKVEAEVSALRLELQQLRKEFQEFRDAFS